VSKGVSKGASGRAGVGNREGRPRGQPSTKPRANRMRTSSASSGNSLSPLSLELSMPRSFDTETVCWTWAPFFADEDDGNFIAPSKTGRGRLQRQLDRSTEAFYFSVGTSGRARGSRSPDSSGTVHSSRVDKEYAQNGLRASDGSCGPTCREFAVLQNFQNFRSGDACPAAAGGAPLSPWVRQTPRDT
jgi:hypothetical protein